MRRCWWCAWPRAPTPAAAIITVTTTASGPPHSTTGGASATPKVRDKTAGKVAGRIKRKISDKTSGKIRPKIRSRIAHKTACKIAGTIACASAAIAGARDLDEWRSSRETQNQGQDSGQDRGQALARDRGEDRTRESYDRRRARYDEWRRARDDWRRSREREDSSRRSEPERGEAALRPGRGGPFAAVVEKLVRGCGQQGTEFENWPFDAIAQIVGADEKERNALAALRESAKAASERLAADCPQDVPAAPSARLEAVEQGIDATLAAFDQVQPALTTFYGALDDEQKARLYRDMAAPAATARETRPRRQAQEGARPESMGHAAIAGAPPLPRARRPRARPRPAKPPRRPGAPRAKSSRRCCATGRCARSSAMCV